MLRVASICVALSLGATALFAQEPAVAGACARPDSVAFRGNSRVSDAALRGDLGITPGSELNYRALQRAIRNLYATTQFDDVQVHCEVGGGHAVLAFALRERPILGDVDVRGAERVAAGTLRDQVDLLIGRPVDPSLIARAITRMDSVYAAKGYYLARVRAETTTVSTGAKISFIVEEGQRMAVSGVRLDGNTKLSDREVVSGMQTKPEGFFWWHRGEFDDNKYAGDLAERIPQTYGRHGFIDAQLIKDTLIVDRDRGKALVDIGVREGPQYVVGDFEVNGARRFSGEDIRRFYPFTDRSRTIRETISNAAGVITRRGGNRDPADVFDQSKWDDATRQVQEAYSNEGYIYAQVRPVIERVRVGKDSTPTVNLRWDIEERTPAIVNRVEILGNDITTESCIRDQILMFPGDVFNRDRLLRSYQSISQMGFFETPVLQPDVRPANEQGDVDIVFHVKEKKTGNVSFGASVGQGTGVGGFIGFDQPNLFGLCKRGSLQWQFGKYINDFNLSYTDPRIRESRVSGTVTGYHTRSRFIVGNLGRTTRSGGQVRFGFPIPGSRWTRLFVDYGGESVSYGDEGFTSTIQCGGGVNCFRSSVGVSVDRDTRIDMPFPSFGAHQTVAAQFNGGPLGGSAAYQRYTGELRGYATLATLGGDSPGSQPIKLVTGLTTKVGTLFGNPGPFFIYQQFSLGGVQYGEQLRGYEEFSITPNGYIGGTSTFQAQQASFGSAFLTTSAELGLRVSQQLYLSSFFDAGNIWAHPRDFNPTRLFRGAGFGAALVTPLGPLGLDLGYGFDRVDALGRRAPKWQVHFKFGQFF
ncbi:MAG TPA: outer membrane protein assembly factor BamA [Gemmatimonadaceae bacterium]|nr:outer membrane protein assembly factor BamA [Gemmatimonadaceae bacterium]